MRHRMLKEVSRVLKVGGKAMILSDPISGILKRLGGSLGHDRHALINENVYSIFRYHRAFKGAGFEPKYLFSKHYDLRLKFRKHHPDARFARIGNLLSLLWKNEIFRRGLIRFGLWPAHIIMGFPMNAILTKKK